VHVSDAAAAGGEVGGVGVEDVGGGVFEGGGGEGAGAVAGAAAAVGDGGGVGWGGFVDCVGHCCWLLLFSGGGGRGRRGF